MGYFYGWYFKCQSQGQTLAVIPAIHQSGGRRTCSLQVITEEEVRRAEFPGEVFRKKGRQILMGGSSFGERGIILDVHEPGLEIRGRLKFGALTPLAYDIMGPFSLVPFLECRHSVLSMKHSVRGTVHFNGRTYCFEGAEGYWEGDRGHSFPREYIWTHCSFPGGALMLSVADVPAAGFHFRGIIGVVLWQGREYRFATYLGARAVRPENGAVRVIQGGMELEAELLERKSLEKTGKILKAPAKGQMVRTIRESAACRACYRFRRMGCTILEFETDRASFEYEYSG